MPYDQLMGQMKEGAQALTSCPLATQDEGVNDKNRDGAIGEADYRKADAGSETRCGTCTSFDQTPDMLACIQGGPLKVSGGEPGYCRIWHFVCASMMMCESWRAD